jgi:predicted oxidoreductase (fatty acid repression mutant protein)
MGSTGTTATFLEAVKDRRSIYALTAESPISDARIEEIVKHAVKWAPSTYNVQSARAVVLFGDNHKKLWEIVKTHMAQVPLEGGMRAYIDGRIAGYAGSYGTVMWFEDQAALDGLGSKNPMVVPMLTEWSDHSSGIHQFIGKCCSWLAANVMTLSVRQSGPPWKPKVSVPTVSGPASLLQQGRVDAGTANVLAETMAKKD